MENEKAKLNTFRKGAPSHALLPSLPISPIGSIIGSGGGVSSVDKSARGGWGSPDDFKVRMSVLVLDSGDQSFINKY